MSAATLACGWRIPLAPRIHTVCARPAGHDGDHDDALPVIAPPARLWRCATCGKWSHAKRKPQRHSVLTEEWRAWVSRYEPGDPLNYMGDEPEQYRTCGPFTAWTATPSPDPRGGTTS